MANNDSTTTPTLWKFWIEYQPSTWQDAVATAAILMAEDHIKDILADPDATMYDMCQSALELGAVLGYALRDTEGQTIKEIGDWPSRAMERADLEHWTWMREQLAAEVK